MAMSYMTMEYSYGPDSFRCGYEHIMGFFHVVILWRSYGNPSFDLG
jgi:hypothetical protein